MKLIVIYKDKNVVLKKSSKPPAWYLWVRSAANLLPVTAKGKILVMHEYKAVTKEWIWGFPGGIIEPGESAAQAANRECQEELGLKAKKLKKIAVIKTGFPDTSVTYFLGFGLRNASKKNWEKIGKLKEVALRELVKLAKTAKIQDPRMVAAIIFLNEKVQSGKIKLK